MNSVRSTLATAAIASLLATAATAGDYPREDGAMQAASGKNDSTPVSDMRFDKLDTNGDGYLSQREVQQQSDLSETRPGLIERWNAADRNRDDRLDKSEFSAFEPARPQDRGKY
jgi:hypothetical protein